MGRRSIAPATPAQVRASVAKHFRHLMGPATGINLAQFQAQLHEESMVQILVGFACDVTLPAPLRRDCALDVIRIARGPIAPWIHDARTIDPDGIAPSGKPISDEIEEIRKTAELHQRLDELVRRGVPPALWPEDVRKAAGDFLASYTDDDPEDRG